MDTTKYAKAIDELDEPTAENIAEYVGDHAGHARRVLKHMTENGEAVRERDGRTFKYSLVEDEYDDDEDASGASVGTGVDVDDEGRMPVHREYDFRKYRVEEPHEYFSSDGELQELRAQVKGRHAVDEPVRALIDGDTGTGKTTLAENISATENAAYFEVQMSPDMSSADLFGSPSLAGDESVWVDGTVTKALMASASVETQVERGWARDEDAAHEGIVVLLVDEVNRAPARTKNALFSALDHRARITLEGPRAGEVIQGDALDLVVIGTINQGDEYHGTARMDLAEKGRWTTRFTSEYLATSPHDEDGIEREAELLVERKDVAPELARTIVERVATIREQANNDDDRIIQYGVPTRSVLAWGGTIKAYHAEDVSNPVMRAAERCVVKSIYDMPEQADARDEVRSIISDKLDGAPVESSEYDEYAADEIVSCTSCDFRTSRENAEDEGITATMECPECGGMVSRST
jgi:nitric oxide reductase NorQ protein